MSARFRTIALDSLYDFGLSIRRRKLKTPQDLVNWLDEALEALLPQGQVNLAGLSYGGWLATMYALSRPERTRALVMIAPAQTVLPVSAGMILRALLTLLPLPVFRKRFYYWLLQDAVQAGASGRAAVDEAVADWGVAQRCFLPMPMIPATVLGDEALKSFHVPALFLIGENEKMYPAQKAASRLNRLAPQIKTEIIHQAGHDLTFTQPNLVTKKMMTFLEQT